MTLTPYVRFVRIPLLVLLGALALMGVFSKRGWLDRNRIERRNVEMEGRIEELKGQKADLERRLAALKSDPAEQERIIRRILGYVRPNETVIEFP